MAKILIVEDDELVARMYQQAFSASGLEVEAAVNGREGLRKAEASTPDLILLDIMMPEMNGLEVLTALKQNEDLKAVPVIMLTNLSGTQDAQKAKELGALDYLVKSALKPREVVEKVKKIL